MQNNFNFVAPFYDPLARLIFGRNIKNAQTWLLPFIPENATVLIIGGGTGWILEEVLQHTRATKVLYLEASEKMLQLAQKRYQKTTKKSVKVEFRLGTEQALLPSETFDVLFTGFLLDLFLPENLQKLMQKLFAHLKPDGTWLVADFAPQNASRFWQKTLLTTMVWFFKFTANLQADKLPQIETAFSGFPLAQVQKQDFFYQLIFAAAYQKR